VADDHPVVRQGIVSCLGRRPQLEVVGVAQDGREALLKARQLSPDVLLLDISMPQMTGLAVAEALRKELPRCKVLILSTPTSPDFVLRIIQSGAHGYVLKDASPEELVEAIETVSSGQTYFGAQVARVALEQFVQRSVAGPNKNDLTNREKEVLTHLAEGLSNKEIACRLNLGTRTVETHREHLMRKLNIRSVAGLTKYAVIKGFVTLPELALAS
jgi:DNA-binding NarL/FixJ family response regulator